MQSTCPGQHKPGSPELGQVCVAATGLHDCLQASSLSLHQGSDPCRRQHVPQLEKIFMLTANMWLSPVHCHCTPRHRTTAGFMRGSNTVSSRVQAIPSFPLPLSRL